MLLDIFQSSFQLMGTVGVVVSNKVCMDITGDLMDQDIKSWCASFISLRLPADPGGHLFQMA